MRIYFTFVRAIARQLKSPVLPIVHTESTLNQLFTVHCELVSDGVMNWGRFLYFIKYAEECGLMKEEWDVLFEFLKNAHPNLFPNVPFLLRYLVFALGLL